MYGISIFKRIYLINISLLYSECQDLCEVQKRETEGLFPQQTEDHYRQRNLVIIDLGRAILKHALSIAVAKGCLGYEAFWDLKIKTKLCLGLQQLPEQK